MKKRTPLLVDEFLSNSLMPHIVDERKRFLAMRERLRLAKKFVFDEKAAHYAAEMIRDLPWAVAQDQEFAIPPFPSMYIELPYIDFFQTINQTMADPDGDSDVGYFIDGPTAYVLSRAGRADHLAPEEKRKFHEGIGSRTKTAMVMPVRYRLNRPFTIQEELDACERLETSRIGLDVFFWGSSAQKMSERPHLMRSFRAHHSFEQWYGEGVKNMFSAMFTSAAGDLRNVIALILFLNRTSNLRIEDEIGFHRSFVGSKPATLVKHSVVRFKLDPKPMLKRIYGTGGLWRREHDVRGHFCHSKTVRNAQHEHQWQEYDVNQWRCMLCGGLKWWRKSCKRGTRDKGRVETSYEVTK